MDFRKRIVETIDLHMFENPAEVSRNHMADALFPLFKEAMALGWEEAKQEIRVIPCWYADEEHQGFDLWENEEGEAQEGGARIEVMRVLNNNPYKEGYVEERPRGKRVQNGQPRVRRQVITGECRS